MNEHKPRSVKEALLTQDELREYFSYLPETGELVWLKSRKSAVVGKVAGALANCGYRMIKFHGYSYLAHRLVWMFVHGFLPWELDHINQNKLDNRVENLRPATRMQNALNQQLQKNNTSGVIGVHYCARRDRWIAHYSVNGAYVLYKQNARSFEEAAELRRKAVAEYGAHWATPAKEMEHAQRAA